MKTRTLTVAIGLIDEDLIEQYDHYSPVKKPKLQRRVKWGASLVCLCLVVIGVISLFNSQREIGWPIKEVPKPSLEISPSPRWEDMDINGQFNELSYNEYTYHAIGSGIDTGYVGQQLAESLAIGMDEYSGIVHQTNVTLYSIQNISADCAVAVKFPEAQRYYVYINAYYQPDTLGQFINDLSLADTIRFGSVWYDYQKPSGEFATIEFTNLDSQTIWDMLLSDRDAAAVRDYDDHAFITEMSISVNIPLFGVENAVLAVTSDGYLTTNILASGKAFFIGQEKVREFVDYVIENCEGHEIVYVDGEDAWLE